MRIFHSNSVSYGIIVLKGSDLVTVFFSLQDNIPRIGHVAPGELRRLCSGLCVCVVLPIKLVCPLANRSRRKGHTRAHNDSNLIAIVGLARHKTDACGLVAFHPLNFFRGV